MNGDREVHERALKFNREALMVRLHQLDMRTVIIDYEGRGGIGKVSEPTIEPEMMARLLKTEKVIQCRVLKRIQDSIVRFELEESACLLHKSLEDFVLAWVGQNHPGWERNDGGKGTVTIHVEDNRFELEYEQLHTTSSYHYYVL
ncbi:hypothetical protein DW355_06650 [Hylemonella gracilis]|uniref:DUF6878 domain-containing protein n=1 Tax=Hylemonella gracilis TaxID=80880 RepID=A0A4P6UGX0_9BURK|nr:DUF6878 family protein [Hylemonella gracilis]QBK04508.1 hypothetical protein DW355_06650 [Hylemonella gracilis]